MKKKKQQLMNAPGLVYAPEPRNNSAAILIVAVIIFLGIIGCMCNSLFSPQEGSSTVFPLFILWTSPIWGGFSVLCLKFMIAKNKRSGQELLREAQNYIAVKEYEREKKAIKSIAKAPETVSEGTLAVLGAPIIGDLTWCTENWFVLPERSLSQHGVLIGSSGSGKTITLL